MVDLIIDIKEFRFIFIILFSKKKYYKEFYELRRYFSQTNKQAITSIKKSSFQNIQVLKNKNFKRRI